MKILRVTPNSSGAYPPIQESNFNICPDGYAVVPDELDTAQFYSCGGFVTLAIKDGIVTGMTADTAAWTKWQADHPAPEPTTPGKTDEERISELKAALAAMKGVTG
jgi:hypothetical protein